MVERLLSITGEDMLTVDRKYREPWTGKLPTRFVMLTNELPRFRDSSGGHRQPDADLADDRELPRTARTAPSTSRLRAELPGILTWALEGLDRLIAQRPVHGATVVGGRGEPDDRSGVAGVGVRPGLLCPRPRRERPADDLYDAWKQWAEDNGHHAGAKSTFGRDLRAVVPELKISQPRVSGGRNAAMSGSDYARKCRTARATRAR